MTPVSSEAGRQPAARPFRLELDDGPFRFTEKQKFIMLVLWTTGLSASTIAKVLPTTRQRVINFVTRGDYAGRSAMTDEHRQARLNELRAVRFEDGVPLDGGELDRISWKIQPLIDARKRRPARKARAS